jgi:diguanylate cyclase (GGDEF)-like protein/PAS domain S-box-containing protein
MNMRIADSQDRSMPPVAGAACDGAGAYAMLLDSDMQRHLSEEVRMLVLAVMQSGDAVMIASSSGIIQFVNPAFERESGYSASEAVGRPTSLLKSGQHPAEFFERVWRTIRSGEVFRGIFINRRKSGELFYDDKTITPIRDAAGTITHFVSTGRDVTDRIQADTRLRYLENYDVLTNLPNRRAFMVRLEQAIARSGEEMSGVALVYVDLDRFKNINDTLGHGAGDRLLKKAGERLAGIVSNPETVARLGGDEFAIVLEGIRHAGEAERLAQQIVAAFANPFELNGRQLYVNASVGIASFPEDSGDAESLVKHADIAMFHAKLSGRATWVNFSSVMEGDLLDNLSLETSLHSALANNEFELVYQPVIAPNGQRMVAVEALLRWNSPLHGRVPPSRFIPLLEATGMIVPVGRWVLETACAQMRTSAHLGDAGVVLAVNLSGRQFRDERIVEDVREVLRTTGLPPSQLELEITESILIEDSSAAVRTLDSLKALGVRLAIDDFGTGYSSLSYLRRFPLDTLKIDRSFVIEMESSPDAVVVVRAIVNLAHSLGLEVVGEGVETAGQLALLSEMGCGKVQGYWFSPPRTADELAGSGAATAPLERAA